MNEQLKQELAEFEALVEKPTEDCDKCKMGCRHRLQWMDSELRILNELAGRLERLEMRFSQVLAQYEAHCRICARLNLLCVPRNSGELPKNQESKGLPQDDNEETDLEKKLTHWN